MGIIGVVSKEEVDRLVAKRKVDTYSKLLDEIVQKLKENTDKYVEIDPKDVQRVRRWVSYLYVLGNIKEEFKHIYVFKAKSDDGKVRAFAKWVDQPQEPAKKKKYKRK